MQVKTFFHSRHDGLQDDLNNWLADQPGEILGLTGDSNEYGHMLTVLYEPGADAAYEALVQYHSQHGGLAVEANEAIAGRTVRFMVQGTNKYGHMLVFLVDAD